MKIFSKSLLSTFVGLTLAAGTLSVPAHAAGEVVSIEATATSLSGSSLSGFDTGKTLYIILSTSAGSLTWQDQGSGTQRVSDNASNVSTLWLSGTQDQLNSALLNEITVTGPCSGNMTISASVSEYKYLKNPVNGHLYTISDLGYSLEAGIAYAETLPLIENGTDTFGYVATLTDEQENSFVTDGLGYGSWISATDADVEGEWRWAAGPEEGLLFWTGEGDGQAPEGVYANWGGGEPNNSGNEDYLEVRTDKKWNDIGPGERRLIIEWGGMPGDDLSPVVFFEDSDTVTIVGAIDGEGTEQDPYLVSNQAEFSAIGSCAGLNVYFQQDQDITLTGFEGVGSENSPFIGHYLGDGYQITQTGLTYENVNRRGIFNSIGKWEYERSQTTIAELDITADASYLNVWGVGLLVGESFNSEIRDIQVDGSIVLNNANTSAGVVGRAWNTNFLNVTSSVELEIQSNVSSVGGISGENSSPYMENSKFDGKITAVNSGYGVYSLGGISGHIDGGEVRNTRSTADISAAADISGYSWGGLFGSAFGISLSRSEATGTVLAPNVDRIGGLLGGLYWGSLSKSRSSGAVSGNNNVGGLLGEANGSNITDTYSSGAVTSNNAGGALVGYMDCGDINSSYAYGKVVADYSRALVGDGCGSVRNSYWIGSLVEVVPSGTVDQEVSITTSDAQVKETFVDWNIADYLDEESTWVICESSNSGYPTLQYFGGDCLLKNNDTGAPTLLGSGVPNGLITVDHGNWAGEMDFTYVWKADGEVIDGATRSTFVPDMYYLDKDISLELTGSKSGYKAVTRESTNYIYISIPSLSNKTEPLIVGSGKAGVRLTVNKGNWDAGVTFTYVWKADGQAISGATSSTFAPGEDLEGQQITLDITGTKEGYRTETLNSGNSVTVSVEAVVTPSVKRTVTKAFTGFTAHSWSVPASLKAKIKALTKSHSSATSVLCTGIVKHESGLSRQSGVGFNRAKAACAEILKIKPGIKVTYAWKYAAKGDAVQRGVTIRFNK